MKPNMVTIVTGGGRGIGRAIARRMAEETAVLVVGRTKSDLQSVCEEIRQGGGIADYCVGDVSKPATAHRVIKKIEKRNWTVANLVCNAGIGTGGPLVSVAKETMTRMFEVNVYGAIYFMQACLPKMIEQKSGKICLISSIAGVKGFKYQSIYCATKHALVGLASSVGQENAKHGVVVVALCPGFVESAMTRRTIAGLVKHRQMTAAEAEKLIAEQNPQQRILPPEEVAEAVASVCSGKLDSLNGSALIMTGGA